MELIGGLFVYLFIGIVSFLDGFIFLWVVRFWKRSVGVSFRVYRELVGWLGVFAYGVWVEFG